jgi:hypothetical protein
MNVAFLFAAVAVVLMALLGSSVVGCSGRPQLLPNSDKNLQRTSTEFAADAARRFPYKMDAPRGGEAEARAQVGYWADVLELINLSEQEWTDVEVWLNQQYVVTLPKMEPDRLKHMTFQMFFNDKGKSFPTDNMKTKITKLELLRDGKMYDVKLQLAD